MQDVEVKQGYSIDTSSLINGCRDDQIRLFLEQLIRGGRLKTPPGVLNELEVGADEVFDWANSFEHQMVRELTPDSASQLGPLVERYGDPFVDPKDHGRTHRGLIKKESALDADPEVIGLALDHGWTVVSDETSGIKAACDAEGVRCISLIKLVESEGPSPNRQLSLDLTE